eukprot:1435051-Amphidinium_carterae.2
MIKCDLEKVDARAYRNMKAVGFTRARTAQQKNINIRANAPTTFQTLIDFQMGAAAGNEFPIG